MGMTCWSVKRRINDYVDGRLRGSELTRFEAHLSSCGECELRIDEVRSVRSSLRGLPPSEMPADLRVRLRVRASQERIVLLETNGSRLLRAWNAWKFRLNEMMRPADHSSHRRVLLLVSLVWRFCPDYQHYYPGRHL